MCVRCSYSKTKWLQINQILRKCQNVKFQTIQMEFPVERIQIYLISASVWFWHGRHHTHFYLTAIKSK